MGEVYSSHSASNNPLADTPILKEKWLGDELRFNFNNSNI